MGVKSTVTLPRMEAIEKYADLKIKVSNLRRRYMAVALVMDKAKLEEELMQLNDKANGGEGFENYIVLDN